jgi:hypothetical protein
MIVAKRDRMRKRRVMAKAKVYGFSPWVDQVDAINQIMKETAERTESALLRKLVDEALEARRKNRLSGNVTEESKNGFEGRLEIIENLLTHLLRQGDVSFRIHDVCLVLLQDVLAEAYATRRLSWESLVVPQLREKGIDANELARRFTLQTAEAIDDAISRAERIKESQEPPK